MRRQHAPSHVSIRDVKLSIKNKDGVAAAIDGSWGDVQAVMHRLDRKLVALPRNARDGFRCGFENSRLVCEAGHERLSEPKSWGAQAAVGAP